MRKRGKGGKRRRRRMGRMSGGKGTWKSRRENRE